MCTYIVILGTLKYKTHLRIKDVCGTWLVGWWCQCVALFRAQLPPYEMGLGD